MSEVQLKVRLSEELRSQVQEKAKEENKSVNQALVDLLERYVNGQEEVEIPKQVEVIDKPYSKTLNLFSEESIQKAKEKDWDEYAKIPFNPLGY